ncbi:hypothetical protein ElyMa_004787200 [Elysia marginata]|uniref:Uncharacterized protein n=1 Tax=Elysia marginata TaxID=1093978 RepID=A0AAV4IJ94_9GAST|nr:hypothetical protein ElyMa_004787200 [Elysia marginata]
MGYWLNFRSSCLRSKRKPRERKNNKRNTGQLKDPDTKEGEKKAGPASEYLEAKHGRRIKEMGDHLARVTEDCPEQSAMADGC